LIASQRSFIGLADLALDTECALLLTERSDDDDVDAARRTRPPTFLTLQPTFRVEDPGDLRVAERRAESSV
jgi:hypothetical protein